MPYVSLSGMSTTKRPGRDTSWVRRAPLVPIGFLVTWQMMLWPVRSNCSIRASLAAPPRRPRVGLAPSSYAGRSTSSSSKRRSPR